LGLFFCGHNWSYHGVSCRAMLVFIDIKS
jgi:hypothetical protein